MMNTSASSKSIILSTSSASPFDRRFMLMALVAFTFATSINAQDLRVARIIDGDTFELSDGQVLRLIGIDTPEVHSSSKLDRDAEEAGLDRNVVQALGRASSEFARALVSDRRIELEFDQANAATNYRDRYGRTLAYVWVLNDDGDRLYMINRRMILDGYANAYTLFPFAYMNEFRELERSARQSRRGLWSAETMTALSPFPPPRNQPLKPESLVGSFRSDVFHRQSCRHATNLTEDTRAVFADSAEATRKGYRACRVCRPDERL
jgi:endonuclease YncB( thermonuclease family)